MTLSKRIIYKSGDRVKCTHVLQHSFRDNYRKIPAGSHGTVVDWDSYMGCYSVLFDVSRCDLFVLPMYIKSLAPLEELAECGP